jgi:hypothetical protein
MNKLKEALIDVLLAAATMLIVVLPFIGFWMRVFT